MIKSFSNKDLENLYYNGQCSINRDHIKKLERILDRLDQTNDIDDMNYPGSKLHKYEPKNEDRWSVNVNKNWRITFIFKEGNSYEVNYLDPH